MPHRRILVASPIEPSGASWLLNCFLELDIRVDHNPVMNRVWRGSAASPAAGRMWIAGSDNRVVLNPRAGVLMKFLPALVRHADFRFRDDVSVEYVQDFPRARPDASEPDDRTRVLMVRDPRDAIYSSYRRGAPSMSFAEFLHFPNPETLLDRPHHWALFAAAWLAVPGIKIVRFEEYKRDAEAVLRSVLAALGLSYPDRDIADAVRLSSFESARDAERAVRDRFPHDQQLANRSGTVGEGRDDPEVRAMLPEIEAAAGSALRALGYAAKAPLRVDLFAAARLSAAFLAFFDSVRLPASVAAAPLDLQASEEILFTLLAFATRADADLLVRAGIPPAEQRVLLDSLAEFTRRYAEWLVQRLGSTRLNFSDGSSHFFNRIRTMRQARPDPAAPESRGDGKSGT